VTPQLGATQPREPKPEDFGLTQARAEYLSGPISARFFALGLKGWPWFLLVGAIVVIGYEKTQSLLLSLLGLLLWLPLSLFGVAILVAVGDFVWSRLQPDHLRFQEYERAKARYKHELTEWERTQERWWRALDGRSFEVEVGRLFGRLGYAVSHTGRAGDEGIDLLLTKDGRTCAVQCKAHKRPVGPIVRDLYGTLHHHQHAQAWLVSTSSFTPGAKRFASGKPIRLLDISDLLTELRKLP